MVYGFYLHEIDSICAWIAQPLSMQNVRLRN